MRLTAMRIGAERLATARVLPHWRTLAVVMGVAMPRWEVLLALAVLALVLALVLLALVLVLAAVPLAAWLGGDGSKLEGSEKRYRLGLIKELSTTIAASGAQEESPAGSSLSTRRRLSWPAA